MKQLLVIACTWLLLLLYNHCAQSEREVELASLPWVESYGYAAEEVSPIAVSGRVPGPQVFVTIGDERRTMMIDLNSLDFIIKENTYKSYTFEPQRMSNKNLYTREMLFEDGYIHDVALMNLEYPLLYTSILKHSTVPLPAKGIIGRQFFTGGHLTIDLQGQALALSNGPFDIPGNRNRIPINMDVGHHQKTGYIKFPVKIDSREYTALLTMHEKSNQISPELVTLLGEHRVKKSYTIDSLSIGTDYFLDLNFSVNPDQLLLEPENSQTIHLSFGMDFFQGLLWTIDFVNEEMLLENRKRYQPESSDDFSDR